jgi:tetratricopeptide (TPR) repeat protein
MRGSSLQQRVRRAELSDYAAFRTFLTIAAGIEGLVLLLWSLVYLGNLSIFLTSVMLAGAAGASGAIFGFLLGIPKVATLSARSDRVETTTDASALPRRYEASTALEEISEWLTKIVVGLGLVEFGAIVGNLNLLAGRAAPLFAETKLPTDALTIITIAILLTNFLLGFSAAYIFTRMFLVSAFFRVDVVNQDLLANNNRISELDSEAVFDQDLTPGDQRSAIELLKVPFSSLRTRQDYLAWAKAHLIFRDYRAAAEALRRALDRAQWQDPELLSLYARTLAAQQNFEDSEKYLEMALALARKTEPWRVPEIVADQIDGALASGRPGDLQRGRKRLRELSPDQRAVPRLLALGAALAAQELPTTPPERARELRSTIINAVRALKESRDEHAARLLSRLQRGLRGEDGLFHVMRNVTSDSEITSVLNSTDGEHTS